MNYIFLLPGFVLRRQSPIGPPMSPPDCAGGVRQQLMSENEIAAFVALSSMCLLKLISSLWAALNPHKLIHRGLL